MRYDDRKEKIGKRIQMLRKGKKIKQAEFLQMLYMSQTSLKSLRNWEKGETLPDLDTLVRMADVFGCDIGYLLCDYDEINRDVADICSATGFSPSAAHVIQNLDFVVGNDRFKEFENGTLSKRHILSQLIADDRIIHVLIAAKQAKSLKYSMRKNVAPDVTAEDFSQALYTLSEMNMVTLRSDDSVNFYIQESGRIFMDILRTMIDSVSDSESYSTDRVSNNPKITIKRLGPEVWLVDDKTATKPTPTP